MLFKHFDPFGPKLVKTMETIYISANYLKIFLRMLEKTGLTLRQLVHIYIKL